MKYIYTLLFLVSLFLTSCVKNGDGDTPEPPIVDEKPLALTPTNIAGTWQVYYFTKQIDDGEKLRELGDDGLSITFTADNKFYDQNQKGVKGNEGTYEIIKGDSIRLKFKQQDGISDTISTVAVRNLTDKRFLTIESYRWAPVPNSKIYKVVDSRYFRNLATMPNQYPGFSKNVITLDQLAGVWRIYGYREYVNVQLPSDIEEKRKEYIGCEYHFFRDKTYKFYDNKGVLRDLGQFVLVDDVIHLFFNIKDPKTGVVQEELLSIRVANLGEKTDQATNEKFMGFTDYSKVQRVSNNLALSLVELEMDLRQIK